MKTTSSIGIGFLAVATAFLSVELLTTSAVARPAAGHRLIATTPMLMWRRQEQLTDEQRDVLFRAQKQWKQTSYSNRAALIQREKQCVDRATSKMTFQRCLKQTRQSRTTFREQYYAYINPIRQQLGLAPLEWVERR
jgi:uncharacterized protein YkwD|tara:strand:- start:400 stop:810 length:411 start_codon:yes stop_codon:yes gene_type:complete